MIDNESGADAQVLTDWSSLQSKQKTSRNSNKALVCKSMNL